ncbi:MAG: PHP domain-containing protein [Actinomycetota bacterium]|nr:PHP domain-containing protein [Actinomycetota bacterium]
MRIDLHTHSRRSDGTDSPAELVAAADAAGLDVVALTDHDTAAGWDEAHAAAEATGVVLLTGIEISCRYEGAGVHLLAYGPDPAYPPLVRELDRVLEGRNARLPATVQRLRALGITITADDVREVSGDAAATGRPHVADALIWLGVVSTRDEAFDRFLMPGRPAYVDRYATDLVQAIDLVTAAGGVSVLAHPWSRASRGVLDADSFGALRAQGLGGLEADHQDHRPEDRRTLRGIAADTQLLFTGSSDYHGTGKIDHDLGVHTTDPEQLARLLEALGRSAAAARGRGLQPPATPEVLGLTR